MDDYQNASKRHLDDAELLFIQTPSRVANASHLFGVSAECSLKAIARNSNPTAVFGGRNGHIPQLFAELTNVAPAIFGNSDLVIDIGSIKGYFSSWKVEQRYHAQSNFVEATVTQEQIGANQAHLLMSNHLQGLI